MQDFALASLIRRLLRAKTKGEAEALAGDVGADYSGLIWQLVKRLTFRRTLSQNALLHKRFKDIADHYGDRSATDVKGECHMQFGLTIRLRDPQFAWIWERTGALLPYEKQVKLMASGTLSMSSAMTTAELTEYLDDMAREYRARGVVLTDPEADA